MNGKGKTYGHHGTTAGSRDEDLGGIGLVLITLFLATVKEPRLEWGKFWMIKPLIIVPLVGAGGGLGTYFVEYLLGCKGGWAKIISILLSIIGFLIALFLGTVLGLNGTLWN